MDEFLEYFVDNYFEGAFPIELCNHYETVGPQTNNSLEVYNKKLKDNVSRAHPNFYKSIEFFQLTNNSHENESESKDEDEDLLDSSDNEEL
ncbi:unnamed protein product [Brachionus calyciflorus]|uniref:Uncharacterized protein n=1 Tax=Brachionus calyciflorus TaxID=104777 RepID=A0A814HEZ2_9BILA|nr:unnamed protein product [Brachionus calyciflorus]